MNSPEPMLDAALDYARRGWRVVRLHAITKINLDGQATCSCKDPTCTSQGKHPVLKDWVEKATTDPAEITAIWGRSPRSNVGVALGPASGIVAIDIDPPHGPEILEQYAQGDLPDTVEMTTGKGARLIYTIPEGLQHPPKTTVIKDQEGHEGIRLQSTGGQCVMPPSMHPRGVRYAWVEGRSPQDLAPAPMPDWLVVEMCRPPAGPGIHRDYGATEGFLPGEQFNRKSTWQDLLLKHGFKFAGKVGEVVRYTRPGKESGISVTVGHYKAKDGTPALYVFSGNIPKLQAGKCYDLFGAYTLLEHNGDYQAASRALQAQGYGRPRSTNSPVVVVGTERTPQPRPAATPPAEQPWQDPIPLQHSLPAPDFPITGFPAPLQDWMKSVASEVNVPIGYVGANLLGVAAGVIGASVSLKLTPQWYERACLYIAVVAPKTSGKTPTHLAAMKPLRKVQAEKLAEGQKQVFYTTDTTIEAIAPILRDRPRGLLVAADELSGFVLGMNQYKGGKGSDRQFWLSCWSGAPISVLRRNPEAPHLYIPHPCVSVLGGVQPAVLETAFGIDDGFAERFLFEASDPLPAVRATRGDYRGTEDWSALVETLAGLDLTTVPHGKVPATITITDEAWDVFADWSVASAGPDDRDQSLDGFRGKARAYAARLALVLHLLHRPNGPTEPLNAHTMAHGVRLARYYLAHVERVRAGASAVDNQTLRVMAWLGKTSQKAVTRRDVYRGVHRHFANFDELAPILKRLVQHGWLRYADVPPTGERGRRPEALYEIHPNFGGFVSPSVTKTTDTLNHDATRS